MTKSKGIGRGGARPNTGKAKTFFRFKAIPENLSLLNNWKELGYESRDDLINQAILLLLLH
jgi:predicted acetyltransferase